MEIAERIKEVRRKKGMSQIELAKAMNVSQSYINQIEHSHRNPKECTLQKIANALGITKEELYENTDHEIEDSGGYAFILNIGGHLEKIRKSLGLSQVDMASFLGINYTTYSNYENNNRLPRVSVLNEIAMKLGLSVEELIGIDSNKWEEEREHG